MKHLILTAFILSHVTVYAQSPKYIPPKPKPFPDSVLSQGVMDEYAICVRKAFIEKGLMYYRIYGRMRDKGLASNEVHERVLNLETDTVAFNYSLDAFFRYCGQNGNCLYKEFKSIGLTPESAEKVTNYTLYMYKGKEEHNFWDQ